MKLSSQRKGFALPTAILVVGVLSISIAAGFSIERIQSLSRPDQPVVRTMPNLAAEVGLSATVAVASEEATDIHMNITKSIMGAVGSLRWVDDEELLHAVTAISGSSPAYVFALAEALAAAAEPLGLSKELGHDLAIVMWGDHSTRLEPDQGQPRDNAAGGAQRRNGGVNDRLENVFVGVPLGECVDRTDIGFAAFDGIKRLRGHAVFGGPEVDQFLQCVDMPRVVPADPLMAKKNRPSGRMDAIGQHILAKSITRPLVIGDGAHTLRRSGDINLSEITERHANVHGTPCSLWVPAAP